MSAGADHTLLGFDASKMWLDAAGHWPPERRELFLLRRDADPVLSVDEMVWPSVFQTHQMIGMSPAEHQALGVTGPERPEWIGPNLPLWEDQDEMTAYIAGHGTDIAKPYWTIAITCTEDAAALDAVPYGPHAGETRPSAPDDACTFLGYDVADGSLCGGLTNCGLQDKDFAETSRKKWIRSLNRYHLFDSQGAADGFRAFSDERIPKHAPFLVYGVWLTKRPPERPGSRE